MTSAWVTRVASITLLISAGCGSSSGSSVNPGGPPEETPLGALRPLAEYTPFGPTDPVRVPFWKKHVMDSGADFNFVVDLDEPVKSTGGSLWFDWGGTAENGLHFSVNTPNPIVLTPGDTEIIIPVELIESGEYFKEKFLSLELTQTDGLDLDPLKSRAELWIRSSLGPPVFSIPNTDFQLGAGSLVNVPISLSHPSQEPVTLHYSVLPGSDAGDFTLAESGSVLFAPGQMMGSFPVMANSFALSASTFQIQLKHERNGVRYVVDPIDSDLTSNTDLVPQEIHLDENMWTFSVGGIQEFEYDDLRNAAPNGRALPGTPTDHLPGGSFFEPGMEDRQLVDLVEQANPTPIVDPFSGIPLKMYTIAEAASGVAPYLRKSFNATFCGSATQLYTLPEYVRISYYIRLPEGPDANRAVPFVRVGMRFRSLNLNHGVTFRIGSDGFDSAGNAVSVVNTSLGPIGVWDLLEINPATDKYGIVEDEFGVRVWHAHRLDANEPWVHPQTGETVFEVPGQTSGNPIEYPTWLSTGDGSLSAIGLNTIDDATGMGNLPYGFFWEISDDASIFSDALKPYFPKPGNWWEPQGNAVIEDSVTLSFTVL